MSSASCEANSFLNFPESSLETVILITHVALSTTKCYFIVLSQVNEYIIPGNFFLFNDQNNGQYGRGIIFNDSTIKLETKVIKPNLCDYSDAYIFVTRDIKVAAVAVDATAEFKNCAPFTRCVTHINDEHVETAECPCTI